MMVEHVRTPAGEDACGRKKEEEEEEMSFREKGKTSPE
jgi:hypothetical protein